MAKMGILKFAMHMRPHFGQNFLPKFPDSQDFMKCSCRSDFQYWDVTQTKQQDDKRSTAMDAKRKEKLDALIKKAETWPTKGVFVDVYSKNESGEEEKETVDTCLHI